MSDLDKQLDNKLRPSSTEVGLYNPISDAGIQIRDDGCVEIFAGHTSILVDGQSGTITVNGQTINNIAKRINSRADNLHVNTGQLNRKWLPSHSEVASAVVSDHIVNDPSLSLACLARSPLTALPQGLDFPLITGVPQEGQSTTSLRTLVKAVPMFRATNGALRMLNTIDKITKQFEDV